MSQKNSISSAPRRPEKRGSVQKIVRNEDLFKSEKNPGPFEEITLSDDDDPPPSKKQKCATCQKDMTLWTSSRREIHMKVCQDNKKGKEKERIKSKGAAKKLTKTIEQDDVVEDKICLEPQTSQKWEYSKNNVKFARIQEDDEDNRRRKRPRSFAVVELAPRKCQCEIVTTLHSRFMDEFHFKSLQNRKEKEQGVSEHAFQMKSMIQKLARYEQLSWDMQKTFDDMISTTIITLQCSDGELKCPLTILKHRTTVIRANPRAEVIQMEKPVELVKTWLSFVVSATVEWNEEHVEEMMELAKKYGPVGLESILKDGRKQASEIDKTKIISTLTTSEKALEVVEDVKITPLKCQMASESTFKTPEKATIFVEEPAPEAPEPIDVFTSDDPFINFGNIPNNDDDDIMMLDEDTSMSSTPGITSTSMDSFDEWSNNDPNLHVRSKSSPVIQTTPKAQCSKPVFGSHVKILKTDGITPMPEFEKMDEAELKERMKEIGMRPKGKKAMILMLKKAYTTLHPEICTGTPTIRPLIRAESPEKLKVAKKSHRSLNDRLRSPRKLELVAEDSEVAEAGKEEEDVAEKTLNLSNDERETGRICGDDIGEEEEEPVGNSKIEELKCAFLTWIRSDTNTVLYEHVLSLQPVSLEEMLIRLEKADGPLGRIGKAKLVAVLESLRITYQLPQKGGPRKIGGGFKRRL